MPDKGASDEKSLQFSAIYEGMNPAYRDAVVSRALDFRSQVSTDAANALNSAIQKSRVRVTGYRDALRAPHTVLRDPVSQLVASYPELAGAVLRVWAETHQALHDKAIEHLRTVGLEPEYVDLSTKQFRRMWSVDDWHSHRDKFLETYADEGFTEDDAALMLCHVTGRVPGTLGGNQNDAATGAYREYREYIERFLDFLKALPPTAPEWKEAVPSLIDSLGALVSAKEAELKWADDFEAILESIRGDFRELLTFFEHDTHFWKATRVSHTGDFAATLGFAERLRSLLGEYKPIHERAAGISEERERIRKRDELQPAILETIQEIDRLMTEDPGSPGDAAPAAPEHPPTVSPEPTAGREAPGVNAVEFSALQVESQGLRDTTAALRAENQDLRDEVEILKTELYTSQEMEESWRLSYLATKEGFSETAADTALKVESVNAAVEMARQRFKKELTFAPNSESNIESNPFIRPEKVWEALQWLATTYYKSKMGQLRVTSFDQSIKEACGWWYKGDQGETTLSRYKKSYTASAYGKTYWLAEHIGKGTNFDARYTIRIAFDWDDNLRQVIVGYIGRHQQTDAS